MTVMTMNRDALTYYAMPGPFTDLSAHGPRVRELPRTLPELCQVIQGLIVHPFHAELYGLAPERLAPGRGADPKRVGDARSHPRPRSPSAVEPAAARAPLRRQLPALHRAALRVPARARRLRPRALRVRRLLRARRFVDHWVGEVWDEPRGSWRLVDAQLDAPQLESHRITFDPLDVPRTQFLVGGDAWQRCRRGSADPERFGILDMHGLWFVLQNLVRDLAARAKRELLPWDGWGLMLDRERYDDPAVVALLDRVAELTQAGDERHAQVLALHDSEPRLRVPRTIVSFGPGGGATGRTVGPPRGTCGSLTPPGDAATVLAAVSNGSRA